jgi:hypothetical protein
MRLPADRREWAEALCRAAAFLVLAFLIFRVAFGTQVTAPEKVVARISELPSLTRGGSIPNIHFTLEGVPSTLQRDWQRALRSTGSSISWSGNAQPLAVSAAPNANPEGGHTLTAYYGGTGVVQVRDAISAIDSATSSSHFVSFPVAVSSGPARTIAGHDSASLPLMDSVILRPVLVIGKAGWETKFVLAALEEAGWKTNAIIFVAPSVITSEGSAAPIDTARYSAVVALDESASPRAREIIAFVGSGGGLVLAEDAARSAAFASLRVSTTAPVPRQSSSDADTVSRVSARFAHLDLAPTAVAIESHGRNVAVGAIRANFGRVIQTGFTDTWRWRMQGTQQSLIDHRDWWSGLVSKVAYAPRFSFTALADDGAPYADLVSIAGPPLTRYNESSRLDDSLNELFWILLLFSLLLVEWTSRRLRGAR